MFLGVKTQDVDLGAFQVPLDDRMDSKQNVHTRVVLSPALHEGAGYTIADVEAHPRVRCARSKPAAGKCRC